MSEVTTRHADAYVAKFAAIMKRSRPNNTVEQEEQVCALGGKFSPSRLWVRS